MKLIVHVVLLLGLFVSQAAGARLKDIADIEGVRGNQLFGYGIVVGLNGTGDGKVDFTLKSVSNLLEKMGIKVPPREIKVKNVAAVMVTTSLPAFVRPGSKIDVSVASIGDAKSLQGGTLLLTSLKGADGNVYAVAQGELSVGGFSISEGGDSAQKNHPTVGLVAAGATVERSIPFDLFQSKRVRLVLRKPDFTTMTNVIKAVNTTLGRPLAVAVDSASLDVPILGNDIKDPVQLVSTIENVNVTTDVGAKIVVNERTGTVIVGDHVTIGKVALAHGNLNIVIRSENSISQPTALSNGETAGVTNSDVQVGEEMRGLSMVGGEVTLSDLVQALNALGATPRDLISIFQALKRAGALNADIELM